MNIITKITKAEALALDIALIDKQAWADNLLVNRARVAKENLKSTPEWTQAIANTVATGGDITDDWIILLQGNIDGLFKTAAQVQAELPAELPTPVPSSPIDQRVTKRQINEALILAGILDPEKYITGGIATIADEVAKATALNTWNNASSFSRADPLFNDDALLAAVGQTENGIDTLWTAATQLPQ